MAETKTGLEGVLKLAWGQTGTAAAQNGSTIGYVTGLSYEYSDNPIHVFNGSSYDHSKKQRTQGKATVKQLFVNNNFVSKLGTTDGNVTVGRHYMELQVNGVAGTAEDIYAFQNCVLESLSRDVPETEVTTEEWSFFFNNLERLTAANKRIN